MTTTNVLKMNDTAPIAVIIGGTFAGVAIGAYQLQQLIVDEFSARGETITEASIAENVVTYPLLTTEPVEFGYDVNREITMTFEDKEDEDTTYLIEDIDTEFDTMGELEEFIRTSITDHDYTVEQVESCDIKKVVSDYMDITLEGVEEADVDITVYGANQIVAYYVEAPEPTPLPEPTPTITMEVDYSEMTSEQLLEHTDLIKEVVEGRMGKPEGKLADISEMDDVPTSLHRSKTYFLSAEGATDRYDAGKPVYLFVDGDIIGLLCISREELREHIGRGHSMGRAWGDNA